MKVLFRADGNNKIGLGHIYRCLALAKVIETKFDCLFAVANPEENVKKLITENGFCIIELTGVNYQLPDNMDEKFEIPFDLKNELFNIDVVVIDGYWFGEQYQKKIKNEKVKLVCIDDLANRHYYADVIINHAPDFDIYKYQTENYTKIYCGLEYLLIRPEFYMKTIQKVKNDAIFLSIGGVDHYGLTLRIASLLTIIIDKPIINIVVSSNFDKIQLQKLNDLKNKNKGIEIFKDLTTERIINIIDIGKFAILSASTILMEVFTRNVFAATGFYSKNQEYTYYSMTKSNYAVGLGSFLEISDFVLKERLENYIFGKHISIKKGTNIPSIKLNLIFSELCMN
jgi:UDP-2,4-diacetamido-2,4,6-trideoxy-beta-L-altropyranose hydrolase